MDTITHGIAGALIGKALFGGDHLFAPPSGNDRPAWMTRERILTWSAMLGGIFPDSDTFRDIFSGNDLLVITWHRSITHSVLLLPAFALALAALTQWLARKLRWECPSFGQLTLVYAAGIVSHILLDLVNNFGTMVWSPLSWSRPAWDLIFIIDFTLASLLLLPQLLARLYEQKEGFRKRGLRLWMLSMIGAIVVAGVAQITGFPLSTVTVVSVIGIFAGLIFLPALRGWGFGVSRAAWCRAGIAAALLYIGAAAAAHRVALERVKQFAQLEHLEAESLAAMPLPPSVWHWNGLIRTERGVYDVRMDLSERSVADPGPQRSIEYAFYPDALDNPFIEEARQMPQVKTVLWFARFPVMRYRREGDASVVEIVDLRFPTARPGRPYPFTYRVRFDSAGRLLTQGWVRQ